MYKVGDRVMLREDLIDKKEYGIDVWFSEMKKGCEVTITGIGEDGSCSIGDDWTYTKEMIAYKVNEKQPVDTSEFISLDYRTEYHNKVAECERLKAQVEYLWKQVLGE